MPLTDLTDAPAPTYTAALIRQLVLAGVVPADAWAGLSPEDRRLLADLPDGPALADALAARRLLTPFQAARVRAGSLAGMVLGNYRLLEKIGSGGMGVVFRAEHKRLRVPAAVKALFVNEQKNRRAVDRFFQEVRALTGLRHPNLIAPIDAGEEPNAGPDGEAVPYLVMEFVPGRNLDDLVAQDGPMPLAVGCQMAHQLADGLSEAHRHGLVHRDIKPSNVLITPSGRVKLVDFGVARLPSAGSRLTVAGTRLGTAAFMAPEQARDARTVDARADVFGLGATLYYALTGSDPFCGNLGAAGVDSVPRLRDARPDAPPELEAAVAHMMALDPAARTPSAAAAMQELAPFLGYRTPSDLPPPPARPTLPPLAELDPKTPRPRPAAETAHSGGGRVLIVDDEESVRRICRMTLANEQLTCDEAEDGSRAVQKLFGPTPYDLVLLDIDLPALTGDEVLREVQSIPAHTRPKVVMLSGRSSGDELARLLAAGADDFLTKPFSVVQLRSRAKALLRLKSAQDRSEELTLRLAASNAEMERLLLARDAELVHARGALVMGMARIVGERSAETGAHLIRLQRYCRVLAGAAAQRPEFAAQLTGDAIQAIEQAAPLHDIGKVAVPDGILNKPGPLTAEERAIMQTHTTVGADTLAGVASQYTFATGLFQVAVDIARHHHEKWDGTGYPDRIGGEAIPLAARIVAVTDVYDALRARRAYKPGYSHDESVKLMTERSPGHFDPTLLEVFREVAGEFDRIFHEMTD